MPDIPNNYDLVLMMNNQQRRNVTMTKGGYYSASSFKQVDGASGDGYKKIKNYLNMV